MRPKTAEQNTRVVCYRLEPRSDLEPRELQLPEGSTVLRAEYYNGAVGLWVAIPTAFSDTLVVRRFLVISTGTAFDDRGTDYLGTAAAPAGTFVAHVFEVTPEKAEDPSRRAEIAESGDAPETGGEG